MVCILKNTVRYLTEITFHCFLCSLGNTMWLDPLVERKHLKNINVTTNQLNVRMEILKEKYATDNKQVRTSCHDLCFVVMGISNSVSWLKKSLAYECEGA